MKNLRLAGLLIAVALVAWATFGTSPRPSGGTPTQTRDPNHRLVVVSTDALERVTPGETEGLLSAQILNGALPDGFTRGTVLTDQNCQADGTGVSHCTNEIQMGTTTMTIQHDHDMQTIPCLSPGETVDLIRYDEYIARR
jgi:hypothetical protein